MRVVAVTLDSNCEELVRTALGNIETETRFVPWAGDDIASLRQDEFDVCLKADLVMLQNPLCGSYATRQLSDMLANNGVRVSIIGTTRIYDHNSKWEYHYPSVQEIAWLVNEITRRLQSVPN